MNSYYYILWINHGQPGIQDYSEFHGTYEECIEYVKKENRSRLGGAIITIPIYQIELGFVEKKLSPTIIKWI